MVVTIQIIKKFNGHPINSSLDYLPVRSNYQADNNGHVQQIRWLAGLSTSTFTLHILLFIETWIEGGYCHGERILVIFCDQIHNVLFVSVRQDSPLGVTPLDITGYHPPWKQLSEFALRPDTEPGHGPPHFSSLVSQVSLPILC